MDYITRKSLLYKSGLGFYCINHVQGCRHGCRYPCYAWMMARSHGRVKTYSEWCQPKLVADAEELLLKDIKRMKRKPDEIHLCLTTDPFMNGFPEVTSLSLKLIEIINSFGIRCSILTKGILPVELADRSRFTENNRLGISLISLSDELRKTWEPGAVPYTERIKALKELHERRCTTYVHIEPYPTPNIFRQNLEEILEVVQFTDQIHFSGWNYNNIVKDYKDSGQFYRDQAAIVNRFCAGHGIQGNVYINT